jgi:hypothetical protein
MPTLANITYTHTHTHTHTHTQSDQPVGWWSGPAWQVELTAAKQGAGAGVPGADSCLGTFSLLPGVAPDSLGVSPGPSPGTYYQLPF